MKTFFTYESVTEGQPDKLCDQIFNENSEKSSVCVRVVKHLTK